MKISYVVVVVLFVYLVTILLTVYATIRYEPKQNEIVSKVSVGTSCQVSHQCLWGRKGFLYGYPKNKGITLVTHGTVDKIPNLRYTLKLWDGPVAICFYFTRSDFLNNKYSEIIALEEEFPNRFKFAVYSSKESYPINIIRNRALQLVETDLTFLIDIDFVPDPGLYNFLTQNQQIYRKPNKSIYVVPAFAFTPEKAKKNITYPKDQIDYGAQILNVPGIPLTKEDLIKGVEYGSVTWEQWRAAQAATNFNLWKTTNEMYSVKHTEFYEPYIVSAVVEVPFFDERYIAYGDDKNQFHRHLDFLGFKYNVLPNHFLLHIPHESHPWGKERDAVLAQVKIWNKDFKKDINCIKNKG
eukprot:TRINITY_DN9581_c0_g1_i1.p1 TRINITY_DN9581_c0_g1~~TRINITY_DN9581_c0_g1_i1.p1  ORF type:complete len:354 (+),score=35.09 TRINITY_DN9581_c0_g1_i1:65-1126(+)